MASDAEVCRRYTSSMPSPALHCAMKSAACEVISMKFVPGVSMRSDALAMSCGVVSLIVESRPGMLAPRSVAAHHLILPAGNRVDDTPPRLREICARACELLRCRGEREVPPVRRRHRQRRHRRRGFAQIGDFFFLRVDLVF